MWERDCSIPLAFPFSEWKNSIEIPSYTDIPTELRHIGDHIKKKRLETKTLIKDVAQQLNISLYTLTIWEQNIYTPSITQYPNIIKFLGYYPFSDDATLGGKIKRYRVIHGLTYKALGKLIGSCPAAIKNWETNVSVPKPEKVNQILQRLSMHPSKLQKGTCISQKPLLH